MPMVKKSITVTDEQEKWIQARMKTGNYASDSEVIREALRKIQVEEAQAEWLNEALESAERSGYSRVDPKELLQEIKASLRESGDL